MSNSEYLESLGSILGQKVVSEYDHEDYINTSVSDLFDEKPVSLSTFLYDTSFLHVDKLSKIQFDFVEAGTQIYYQNTIEELRWLFKAYIHELVGCWGKGSGKDTVARLILLRISYLLLCLKSPQKYLGQQPYDDINMINVAYSSNQAQHVFFEPCKKIVESSPWFRDHIVAAREQQLEFKKGINIFSGHSSQESLEGHNLIAVVLDEIGAFKTSDELSKRQARSVRALEHSAEAIYKVLKSSASTRFPELFKVILISYPRYKGDYIMQKYEEGRRPDIESTIEYFDFGTTRCIRAFNDDSINISQPGYYVSKGTTWEVNPTKKIEMFEAEIIKDPEDAKAKLMADPPFAVDGFFKNLTDTVISEVFPGDTEKDEPAPFEPVNEFNYEVSEWFKGDPAFGYYGHVDLGTKKDRCGLCIGHRAGSVKEIVPRTLDSGIVEYIEKIYPLIKVDLWVSFKAPPSGEIQIADIRELIFLLKNFRGFNFVKVTYDGWQSLDSIQQMKANGVDSEVLSIDRNTQCYDTLKDYIYSRRLKAYYRKIGVRELQQLVNINGVKVDHPLHGGKDEADALCGMVVNAANTEYGDAQASDLGTAGSYEDLFGVVAGAPQWNKMLQEALNELQS